jgi:hypothetical protein
MLEAERAASVPKTKADQMAPEELVGKIVTGVLLHDTQKPEFQSAYEEMAARVQAEEAVRVRKMREGSR